MSDRASNVEPGDVRAARARSGRRQLRRILRDVRRAAAIRAELDGHANRQLLGVIERLRRHIENVDRGSAMPSPSTFLRLLRRLQRVPYGAPHRWREAAESIHVVVHADAVRAANGAA